VAWKSAGKAKGLMRRVYDDMSANGHAEDFHCGNEEAIARWVWRRCKNSESTGQLKDSKSYSNEEAAVKKIAGQIRGLLVKQSVTTVLATKDSVMSQQTWTRVATTHMQDFKERNAGMWPDDGARFQRADDDVANAKSQRRMLNEFFRELDLPRYEAQRKHFNGLTGWTERGNEYHQFQINNATSIPTCVRRRVAKCKVMH
jgi:hypothetical protein